MSLPTQEFVWVYTSELSCREAGWNAGELPGNVVINWHPIQGRVVTFHVASCYVETGISLWKYVFLGNKAGIMQSMCRGNHMISSAIWDKSSRVNLEHAEIYAYLLLGQKLFVWSEIRPKLPFKIAKFSHSNTVFFICKNILFIQYSAVL